MKVRISLRAALSIECQRARFRQQFGRKAGVEDPLFFDPEQSEPQPIIKELQTGEPIEHTCLRLEAADVDPAFLFAVRKTGHLGLAAPPRLQEDPEVQRWLEAVDEYYHFESKSAHSGHVGDAAADEELALSI